MDVQSALERLCERIDSAARRAGRSAAEVELIAVTKGFGAEVAGAALAAGLTQLGESRVQEARAKIPAVREGYPATAPTWHLIGHLQTNKAGQAADLFDWVHSLDSLKLAEALNARRQGAPLPVLAQIKTSSEPTKTGIAADEALDLVPAIARLPQLRLLGLMTIPARDPDPRVARDAFRSLRELAERLRALDETRSCMEHLSMGMSGDFEIAIEEGATMVRLGTVLFGPRPTHLKA
jgi:pyridoxal phosphate enzyme (YggS family)